MRVFSALDLPGEGYFKTGVVRTLVDFGGAEHEGGLLAQAENGVFQLHGISNRGGAGRRDKLCRFRFMDASI